MSAGSPIIIIALIVFTGLFPNQANARLGERETEALARATEWRAQYGAVAPIVDVDDSGIVWQECWSAPPAGWTPTQAIEFARQLIPGGATIKITRMDSSGSRLRYSAGDGYPILLTHRNMTVYDLEVVDKGYSGQHC